MKDVAPKILKREISIEFCRDVLLGELVFEKRKDQERYLSQHVYEACGQMLPTAKDIPGPSTRDRKLTQF